MAKHAIDHVLADDLWQELGDDQPVVVPGRQAPRRLEHLGRAAEPFAAHVVDRAVVEGGEGAMQPRDDQVLVVARVADDRRAVRPTREVLEEAAAFKLELDVVGWVVELLLGHEAGPVDRIQIQARRAVVARRLWFSRLGKPGVGIEGHVVVEELAEERRPRRVGRVVGVVDAQRRIDDQLLWAGLERVPGVEEAAGLAQLAQRRLDLRALPRERRQPEDPTEVLGRGGTRARVPRALASASPPRRPD
jgi:hypothetical protein